MTPLPLVGPAEPDPVRGWRGTSATRCGCEACSAHCRTRPGYLVPDDLVPLAALVNRRDGFPPDDLAGFAGRHLAASAGPIVVRVDPSGPYPDRVPILRPTTDAGGACVLLTPGGGCAAHPAAPWGCRGFDAHMPDAEAERRSQAALAAVAADWAAGGPYARLWLDLAAQGRLGVPPEGSFRRRLPAAAPWDPQPHAAHRARLPAALIPVGPVDPLAAAVAGADDPGPHADPAHVFDSPDGVRLVVYRARPAGGLPGPLVYVHGQADPAAPAFARAVAAGRLGAADPARLGQTLAADVRARADRLLRGCLPANRELRLVGWDFAWRFTWVEADR